MQNQRFKVFKSQDLETGRFDVTFELDGKKLYAHQFILTSVSETMDAWLSTRWTTKDEVIKISDYSFNDFYEFLRFLYSGDCKITDENVFVFIDMAEFYGVSVLECFCDDYLKNFKITLNNVEEMFEFSQKYSLHNFERTIKKYIFDLSEDLLAAENFLNFQKSFVKFFYDSFARPYFREKAFNAVYEWAKYQVTQRAEKNDSNFNLTEAIKSELSTIISIEQFRYMNFDFLMNFVLYCVNVLILVANGILSEEQANRVNETRVEVKNGDKILTGIFMDDYGIRGAFENVYSKKPTLSKKLRVNNVKLPIPSTPSIVMKMKGVEWYLCLEKDGVFTLKHQTLIERSDYLIAQMENNFEFELDLKKETNFKFSHNFF
uniref:BTB domain-containing protein n=1 Tax=Panagrolaimus sp. ES5 TaxID=591445 RepID=A0AC34FNN5_9BILA